MSVIHKLKTKKKPGTYSSQLNKVLTANKLPNIIIPNDTDTETQHLPEQHAADASRQGTGNLETETRTPKPSLSRHSSYGDISKSSDPLSGKRLESSELGLEFHTPKNK